jgi:DNA-binding transcriptional regulator YbjK
MSLLNVVTAITQEIGFITEMVTTLAKTSEKRMDTMRQRYEMHIEEERATTTAIIVELEELKKKLADLIETPAEKQP